MRCGDFSSEPAGLVLYFPLRFRKHLCTMIENTHRALPYILSGKCRMPGFYTYARE